MPQTGQFDALPVAKCPFAQKSGEEMTSGRSAVAASGLPKEGTVQDLPAMVAAAVLNCWI